MFIRKLRSNAKATSQDLQDKSRSLDLDLAVWFCFLDVIITLLSFVLRRKLHTDAVDTVSLIRRRTETLSFEDMTKVSTTVGAHNFGSFHSEAAIHMSCHCTRNVIEVRRPSAARLELVVCRVERGITAGTGIDSGLWHVLVKLSCIGRLSSLLAQNAKLFFGKNSSPFIVGLLNRVRHVASRSSGTEEANQKWKWGEGLDNISSSYRLKGFVWSWQTRSCAIAKGVESAHEGSEAEVHV